jgi:hydroxylamine reductase (hybrid-cluster protein)
MPTVVPLGHKKDKAILAPGHDLKELEELLNQTKGTGHLHSRLSRTKEIRSFLRLLRHRST